MLLHQTIEHVLDQTPYHVNPYFTNLKSRSFPLEDFLETQIQFYFAVVFFSRPMAALAAKIPEARLRVEVVRNVWEEHGEGDETRVHGDTFLALLERLGGIRLQEINGRALWPEVRIFNTTLAGACVLDEHLIGVAILGIIERMFCEISSWIGHGIVENGWVQRENMIQRRLRRSSPLSGPELDAPRPAPARRREIARSQRRVRRVPRRPGALRAG